MKIGIGQINPTIGDFEANRKLILQSTITAKKNKADLIVFPELCICGYPPMDLLDHPNFVDENLKSLRELQHSLPEDIAVVVGFVDRNRDAAGKPLRNAAAVIYGHKIVHIQHKTLLPTYDVFDESRYFEPATEHKTFEFKGMRIGIAICEDIWWETESTQGTRYPVDPVHNLLNDGASLILAPSASPFYACKLAVRHRLVSSIGSQSGVPVVYANMVGANDNLIFDGNSFITSTSGKVIHLSASFSEEVSVTVLNDCAPAVPIVSDKYQEIENALCLGIKDYLCKCGFRKVHLGLSGGIDSALVTVLAVKALGRENVKVFMLPSQYSSEGSLSDSEELVKNLGINHGVIPIEEIYHRFTDVLEPHFEGKKPDLAEENIQARIRGTLLMAYSNKFSSLVLTTGNKSELAVGYCTIYGDMAGSLAVIGDLFKTEVYDLCRHINRNGTIIPENILTKAPSAELRPDQKDQDSLPPYDELDEILKAYILENLTMPDILKRGHNEDLVKRILLMVGRSEYKRWQTPPVLKVSPKAFGTGRRFPIARTFYEV